MKFISGATFSARENLNLYEKVHRNYLFHRCDHYLRDCTGRGPALVQEHGQKLSNEWWQGM